MQKSRDKKDKYVLEFKMIMVHIYNVHSHSELTATLLTRPNMHSKAMTPTAKKSTEVVWF